MIESATVSKSEGWTNNSPMAPNPYVSTKNPRSRKSFRQFSETLDVKHKTVVSTFCVAKLNLKTIKKGNLLWSNITKRRGQPKINKNVK